MRIMQLTQHYPPFKGGIEVVVHELSRMLVEKGHEVEVVCELERNTKKYEIKDGVEIHRVSAIEPISTPYRVGRIAPSMFSRAVHSKADVCHVHGYGTQSSWISIFTNKPTVVTTHSDLMFRFRLWDYLKTIPLKLANAVTVSAEIHREMLEERGIASTKIKFIRNGVTLPIASGRDIGVHPMILCLARIELFHKGQDILLKAMKNIHEQLPPAKLVIAGTGSDYANLRRLAQKLGIEECVEFTGELSEEDKKAYLSSCDVLCIAPRKDGSPITYLEAMALGRPIVTTQVGGIPEMVGDAGILVPPNDPIALADGVVRVLTDHNLSISLRDKGLQRVKQFDWNTIIDDYVELYETLSRTSKRG